MYRKAAVIAVSAVAVVGVGTAVAVAATQDSGATTGLPGAAPTSSTSAPAGASAQKAKGKHKHGKHGDRHGLLKRVEHGQFVVQGKDGKVQTVSVIQGTVTAVSPTSITVQAADKTSETYTVNSATKVRDRAAGKGAKGSQGKIADVAKGDHVFVAGTGTGTPTATRVVEAAK